MKRTKNITSLVTAALFCLFLFGMGLWTVLAPDPDYVVSERREATPLPTSLDGMDELESYFLDSFPLREPFRQARNRFLLSALGFSDVDGYYLTENGVAKDLSPANIALAKENAAFFDRLQAEYFPDAENIYYALIPDKGYYAESGIPFDYNALAATLSSKAGYIDLTSSLALDAYYATDIHWREDALFSVAETLAHRMGFTPPTPDSFEEITLGEFVGTLGAQAALTHDKDTLTILKPSVSCTVTYPDGVVGGLFDTALFESSYDPYDVFLRGEIVGNTGNFHITVENRDSESGRRLIVFRDSFARSLLPLLVHAYSEIVLVDLRTPFYRGGAWQDDLWADGNTDILFLVSTHTYNTTRFG